MKSNGALEIAELKKYENYIKENFKKKYQKLVNDKYLEEWLPEFNREEGMVDIKKVLEFHSESSNENESKGRLEEYWDKFLPRYKDVCYCAQEVLEEYLKDYISSVTTNKIQAANDFKVEQEAAYSLNFTEFQQDPYLFIENIQSYLKSQDNELKVFRSQKNDQFPLSLGNKEVDPDKLAKAPSFDCIVPMRGQVKQEHLLCIERLIEILV
ncbi:MAG: hypothetical protein MK033_09200 [Candidatus Caenarcaniphilales bacterium]|nr:hypothetical protein [Candidatus Caenarcaniphilales bacterium]